jgi:AraC family ethanolamine operon transcriptional activator
MQNMDRPSLPLASLRAESLQVDESDLNRLRHLAQKMLSEACRTPAVLQSEASRRNMQNVLLNALVSIHCSSEKSGRITRGEIQHAKIVRSVRRYLLDHRDSMVGVPELCREFQISRRTLQYAFELVLGISPHTYLRMLRLNGVRRDLLKKGSTGLSVQNVAADWGFWHMSQFAKDYRSFFNELPSVTLKRRTGLCTAAIRQDFDLPQRRSRVPAAASGRQQRRGTPRSVA